jgi:drug/metabolite transporter (DMT)-like permease
VIDRSSKSYRGYIYIACAALLWGISATLGRAAFTGRLLPPGQILRPIDPLILSQSRTTFSCIVLLIILVFRRGFRSLRLPAIEIGRLALLGVLGVAASNYFYYLAIQRTNVATAIVVQYTAPIWVLLYALIRKKQKPTWQRIGAVVLAVAGIAMVIRIFDGANFAPDRIGIAAAMLAAFSFAFYNVAGHSILTRYDRWIVLLYTTLMASLFWIVVNPPSKIVAAHFSSGQWLFLFIFSLMSVLGPFSFYFAGLQHLEPTRAIVVSCLEPVFSIVIAAAVLGEIMKPLQTLGILLVLAAIVVVQLPGRQEPEQLLEPID